MQREEARLRSYTSDSDGEGGNDAHVTARSRKVTFLPVEANSTRGLLEYAIQLHAEIAKVYLFVLLLLIVQPKIIGSFYLR